jgi:hypothetical protein
MVLSGRTAVKGSCHSGIQVQCWHLVQTEQTVADVEADDD